MKIFILALLFFQIAGADVSLEQPKLNKLSSTYRFFRWAAVDVDQLLQKQGLNVKYCTYKSRNGKNFAYSGVGPCLFEAFCESMKTTEQVSSIFLWLNNSEQGPIQMEWRPIKGGWMEAYRAYKDLSTEGSNKRIQPHSKESLLGEVKIIFPQGYSMKEIYLTSKPGVRRDGKLEFSGALVLIQSEISTPISISYKTNLNFLKSDRDFFINGKTTSLGLVKP